jgi:hypothetical protein
MPPDLWLSFFRDYLLTVAIETPVLLLGLSWRHPLSRRLFAGFWLTACTYPIVYLVLPVLMDTGGNRVPYLIVAETFAPVGECVLFWMAFGDTEDLRRRVMWWDFAVITLANLASFGLGGLLRAFWTK